MGKPTRPILTTILIAFLYHAIVLAGYLAIFRGDLSALVCVNRDWIQTPPFEAIRTGFDSGGYDGQFYYSIARNPFAKAQPPMDVAAMRHIRVGYPIMGWLLTGGDPNLLLYALPLISLFAIVLTFVFCARLAIHFQRPVWWGWIAAFGLNSGMSLLRDLTDPLATMALTGLLAAAICRDRVWMQFAWGLLAVFTREQNVAAVGVLLLLELRQRRWGVALGHAAVVAALAGWVILLKQTYGHWPFVGGNLSYPFQGILWRIRRMLASQGVFSATVHTSAMSAIALLIVGGLLALIRERRFVSSWLIAGGLVLTICGSDYIYASVWSYHRVFTYLPLGLAIWGMETGRRWPLWLVAPGFGWPLLAVAQVAATS